MLPAALRDFPTVTLRSLVGEATFWRGMGYARDGAVQDHSWDAAASALRGIVAGSGRNSYRTSAVFTVVGGELRFDHGRCSCPMRQDCKHTVALVATAVDAVRESEPALQLAAWEQALAGLLPDDEPPPESAILGMELAAQPLTSAQQRAGMVGTRLVARLVTQGRRGWLSTAISWNELPYVQHRMTIDGEQLRLLREFHAVYQAGRGGARGSALDGQLDLAEFHSIRFWPILLDLLGSGVVLLDRDRDWAMVDLHPPAELTLDVQRCEGGDLRIEASVPPGADPAGTAGTVPLLRPIGFLGAEGHGVAYRDDLGCLHLAACPAGVPEPLRPAVLDADPLSVPAADAHRFATAYYPRLRARAAIRSRDESFSPPKVTGPRLLVELVFDSDYRAASLCSWRYRIDDTVADFPVLDPIEPDGIRDPAAEQEVARSIGTLVSLEPTAYQGMDTVTLVEDILPPLRELARVDVEISGEIPEFRDADDTFAITLSTTHLTGQSDWFDLDVAVSVDGTNLAFPDVFRALDSGESRMILPGGAYFTLDRPELDALRSLISEAKALTDKPGDGLRINRYQISWWDELVECGVVGQQAAEWDRHITAMRTDRPTAADLPHGLRATLRPYQQDGYDWLAFLWRNKLGGILADDMGLGKTLQTLTLIAHAREQHPGAPPFLIVAPTSVVPNWADEAARFTPGLTVVTLTDTLGKRRTTLDATTSGADIVVTSYTLFRLDNEAHQEHSWSGLILDEAQIAKNHQSKIHNCCRTVPAPFKLGISGTPIENNLMELWSLLAITAPGLFPNPRSFKQTYAEPIEKIGDTECLGQLQRRIAPLLRRRTKEAVASDLPAKQETLLDIPLHPKHRKAYDTRLQRERQKILGLVDDIDKHRITILQSLTTLRKLSLHAALVDPAHERVPSAKIQILHEHLDDIIAGGHRALVFSQFTSFLALVRQSLDSAGIPYAYLDGSTRDRGKVIDAFRSGAAPVFLISLKAGGFGLNLTEADYVYILDPWWNPATEAQAVDRTHRIGQTRPVNVYRLISRGTIEEKVAELKQRKAQLSSNVLDDGAGFSNALTADDIRGLFT